MEFTDFSRTSFYPQSVWDFGDLAAAERNSLGFMELLGSSSQCFVETLQPQTQSQETKPQNTVDHQGPTSKVESLCTSDHLLPATPNSSSISSASSEAVNEEKPRNKHLEDEDQQKKNVPNKQLKTMKKNNQKRQREARVAFMTKSEVDHLEDGYRWRKYGQKAVKNSPFPRSYYRCTTASCNVKKRVERSFRDPSTVVTTYEGQHTHISPLVARPISTGQSYFGSTLATSNLGNFGFPLENSTLISPQFQQLVHYHQQQELLSCFGGVSEYINGYGVDHRDDNDDDHCVKKSKSLVNDNGLLQDVVPSHMLKEE